MPVKALSGGEQNRAILARLFSKPANMLVLDEPTNDLDVETLELLEEILLEFNGTVLLVSHDREFMDNVETSIYVMPGNGQVEEYVGGYSSWAEKGGQLVNLEQQPEGGTKREKNKKQSAGPPAVSNRPKKLSYKLQRELDSLPALIERLDARVEEIETRIAAADFYQQEHSVTQATIDQLGSARAELDAAYSRWEELEAEAQG
jgi:ATP-binding cassette subfamily F protein uup